MGPGRHLGAAREIDGVGEQVGGLVAAHALGDERLPGPPGHPAGVEHLRRTERLVGGLEVAAQQVQEAQVGPGQRRLHGARESAECAG